MPSGVLPKHWAVSVAPSGAFENVPLSEPPVLCTSVYVVPGVSAEHVSKETLPPSETLPLVLSCEPVDALRPKVVVLAPSIEAVPLTVRSSTLNAPPTPMLEPVTVSGPTVALPISCKYDPEVRLTEFPSVPFSDAPPPRLRNPPPLAVTGPISSSLLSARML